MAPHLFPLTYVGEGDSKQMAWPRDLRFEKKEGEDTPCALVTIEEGNQLVHRWPELFQWPEGFGKGKAGTSSKDLEELKGRFDSLVGFAEIMAQKQEALEVKAEALEGKVETLEAKNLDLEKELAALKKASAKAEKKTEKKADEPEPPAPPVE